MIPHEEDEGSSFPRSVRINRNVSIPASELRFAFARSGGPGGQNVNKVETRVDLLFDINSSAGLDSGQKERIRQALHTRIDTDGVLRLSAQASRSQWRNRQQAVETFAKLLSAALTPKRKRIPSRATGASRERRITAKKQRGRKKEMRGRVLPD